MPVGFSFDYGLVCLQALTGLVMGGKRSFQGSYIYNYIY